MNLLIVNAGSSSLRLSSFDTSAIPPRVLEHTHYAQEQLCDGLLADFVAKSPHAIEIVSHRIVHGGSRLRMPCVIDKEVESAIEAHSHLAPLHNPQALMWITQCRHLFDDNTKQIAIFDTGFYTSLPAYASIYALPKALSIKYEVYRYGFHGIAHQAMWRRWSELNPTLDHGGRLISIQLGSGCSITASRSGIAQDTSMGFSPLEGLVMASRCGDIDPGLLIHLQRVAKLSLDDLDRLLNHESGLLGISGISSDMQILLESQEKSASLAIGIYCYRIRKAVGSYMAALNGIDGIVFSGGVGENSPQIRARILESMTWAGVQLDSKSNTTAIGAEQCISAHRSQIPIWVIPVSEAQEMARQTKEMLEKEGSETIH